MKQETVHAPDFELEMDQEIITALIALYKGDDFVEDHIFISKQEFSDVIEAYPPGKIFDVTTSKGKNYTVGNIKDAIENVTDQLEDLDDDDCLKIYLLNN